MAFLDEAGLQTLWTKIKNTFATTTHSHGNIKSGGTVGTTSGLPLITSTGGAVTTGTFGSAAGTFCQGNDARVVSAVNSTTVNTLASAAASAVISAGGYITTHNSAYNYLGTSGATANATTDTTNSTTYLTLVDGGGTPKSNLQITGAGATTVKAKNGVLTISGVNSTYTGASGVTLTGTTFSHTTGAGWNHIPASGGSAGQLLGYSAAGVAKWVDPPTGGITSSEAENIASAIVSAGGYVTSDYVSGATVASAGNATTVNGKTVSANVPANAVFTDSSTLVISNSSGTQAYLLGTMFGGFSSGIVGGLAYNSTIYTSGEAIYATTFNGLATLAASCTGNAATATSATYAGTASSCTGNAATATSATNAGTATKLGTATLGGANKPIYLSSGTATEGNTFVPNTGGTFSGALHVTSNFYLDNGYLYSTDKAFTKGSTPSGTNYVYEMLATDKNGNTAAYRLGAYQIAVTSTGAVFNEVSTYPNISGDSNPGARLVVWQPKSGTGYVTIPDARPEAGDSSTKVPDTAWVRGATVASAGSAGTITSTLPISKGGTGRTEFTNTNGVLTVAAATSLGAIATANGAFYATAANGVAKFGTLPVAQGGTGATTLASAGIITSAGAQTITGEKTYAAGDLNFTATSAYLKKTLSVASTGFPTAAHYLATRIMCSGGTTTMAGMSQWWSSDNTGISISIFNPRNTTQYTVSLRQHSNASCYFEPTTAGILLGRNADGYKWQQLVASTTTIATSDERYKSNIKAIPDNILDAWGGVQWRQYQFNDAIKEKGEGKARLHTGVIAQHVSGAFAEKGIDITRYGLFCHDEWPAEPEEKDDLGNVVAPAHEASDDFAIRYEEALCMEAAYQRRRADCIEAELEAIKQRLAALESA